MSQERDVIDMLGKASLSLEELSATAKEQEEQEKRNNEEEAAEYASNGIFSPIKRVFKNISRFKAELFIFLFYIVIAGNMICIIIKNAHEFSKLNHLSHVQVHPIIIILQILVPILLWILSTAYDVYNYHNYKLRSLSFCIFNGLMVIWSFFLEAITTIVKVILFSIPTSGDFSPRVVVITTYTASLAITFVPLIATLLRVRKCLKEPLMKRAIINFKIKKIITDTPWERQFRYDMSIVRNLTTHKKYIIKEDDRRLHTKGLGSTGGGKTATILTVSFESDLIRKAKNMDYQKKKVLKLLKKGKVYLNRSFDDADFNIDYISASEGKEQKKTEKILNTLKYKAKSAGMTVMCPNEAFCDELYAKVKAKGLKVNRVDPCVGKDGKEKEDIVGFSPIYVPIIPGEETDNYLFRVFTAAKLYADVNQAIFELSGKGDPYFTGLNKNLAVTGAVTVIIAYPLLYPGEYATIEQVQEVINDFTQIKKYRDAVIDKYGIKNDMGLITKEIGKAKVDTKLQFIIDRIDRDFLGPNALKINEQATGLRNIIDESLMNPRIRKLLCSKSTLDIDRALEKGEITLVNFEISLGSDSTGFGMFFMLSFIQAVLRRPGTLKTRLPHFFSMDEAPMLFHPRLELSTTLFRQYNTSMMLFMQSLTQYEKNDTTRYLKNVLTGNCAHQIIFGRASLADMEFYAKLSGIKSEITESEQTRENALSEENPMKQFSYSNMVEEKERISMDDVRYRDFLECTVLSTKDSAPVPPFLGKTNFLPKNYDPRMKRFKVDWSAFYHEELAVPQIEETTDQFFTSKTTAKTYVQSDISDFNDVPLFSAGTAEAEEEQEIPNAAIDSGKVTSAVEVIQKERPMMQNTTEDEGEVF